MEPLSGRGEAVPALRSVLRPGVSAWERPERDDLDPEQLAREAVTEIEGALKGLHAILDLLGASSVSRSGEVGARSAEGAWGRRLPL
jgi:hypothetical protein